VGALDFESEPGSVAGPRSIKLLRDCIGGGHQECPVCSHPKSKRVPLAALEWGEEGEPTLKGRSAKVPHRWPRHMALVGRCEHESRLTALQMPLKGSPRRS
jgi:hypothetical protein